MDALLLWFALLNVVADLPPEPVVKLLYEQAQHAECQARELYDVGGSWPLKAQLRAAEQRRRMLWATWYAVWPQCDIHERIVWAFRAHAIAGGDERY
jgi:hypothetical protein